MRCLSATCCSCLALLLIVSVINVEAQAQTELKPPVAKVVPKKLMSHGVTRIDNYYWLNERDNPDVIAYLEAENEYTEAVMAHTTAFEDALFEEIRGRIKESDVSVPYKEDAYFYYTRYEEGQEYPVYARRKHSMDNPEEVMLDVNEVAEGYDYFAIGGRSVSSGQNILAYAADTTGRRIFTIRFKDLDTGEELLDVIDNTTNNMAWANDNKTLYYTKQDPTTLRWNAIYRHVLGTDPANDQLVYEETDEEFSSFVFKTKSKAYMMISSQQTLSTEYRYLDADDPTGEFTVIHPREADHKYYIDHFDDKFLIRTNLDAKNFRLMETPISNTDVTSWHEIIPHRADVLVQDVEVFKDHLVVSERADGLTKLRIMPWDGSEGHYLDFGEPAYRAGFSTNVDINSTVLRYSYSSMTTPNSVFDYDMNARTKELLKQDEVLGGFDSDDYETDRIYAIADDGVRIPISIVYRKGMQRDGSNPVLLYGYGSYGATIDASFSSTRLSLIDRGFIYAIAHIRGGQVMGRWWYEDGKLFKKMNTFTDFIAAGEHLIEAGYTNRDRLFAMGGSAGGLLMGAVINLAPELFHGVVAAVPFVDIVTTMLDESIPLTTSEYDEWGNPNEKAYFDYILSYSPYDQVEAKDYPHLLVTTGLHDSQVQYWEPAKWVAKLRALKTDDNRLLLKTNMEAGHGGASGRFQRYREIAFQYAFILDLAGIGQEVMP